VVGAMVSECVDQLKALSYSMINHQTDHWRLRLFDLITPLGTRMTDEQRRGYYNKHSSEASIETIIHQVSSTNTFTPGIIPEAYGLPFLS
jgi:hypothetical protein